MFDLSEQFIAQRGGFAAGTVRPLLTGDHALQGSDLVVLEGDYAFQGFNLRLHSHQALLQFGSRQLRLRQFLQRHVGRGRRRHGARFRTRTAGRGSRSGGLAWLLSGYPQRRPCVHSAAGTTLSPGFILLAHHLVRGVEIGRAYLGLSRQVDDVAGLDQVDITVDEGIGIEALYIQHGLLHGGTAGTRPGGNAPQGVVAVDHVAAAGDGRVRSFGVETAPGHFPRRQVTLL